MPADPAVALGSSSTIFASIVSRQPASEWLGRAAAGTDRECRYVQEDAEGGDDGGQERGDGGKIVQMALPLCRVEVVERSEGTRDHVCGGRRR
jgi:hypothetical protein